MSLVLLDTNLASALYRGDQERLETYAGVLVPGPLAIALQSSAEMRYGAERARWGIPKRNRLEVLLARLIVLTPDQTTAHRWAQVMAHAERIGRPLSHGDGWIAAAAIQNGTTLVSHDLDLADLGFPGLEVVCRARPGNPGK